VGFLLALLTFMEYNKNSIFHSYYYFMFKAYYTTTAKLAILPLLLLPATTNAQVPKGLEQAQESINSGGSAAIADSGSTDLLGIVAKLINIFIGLLGIIFVVLVIYAGWLRIASQGDAGKVEKSNKLLVEAVIGIVIIVAAYAIANFVIGAVIQSTGAVAK